MKLQGLRELRVVVLVLVLVLVLVMWCFYLPGHLTTTFAKQLLKIWGKYELLLF